MAKLLKLSKNKDNKEKLQTKPKELKSLKELNNMNHNIKQPNNNKPMLEEMLNLQDKSLSQPNPNQHSSSESEVLTNLTPELLEF